MTRSQKTEINPDNINATINEMIKDSNVLSAFELNEKNLQFLKELRKHGDRVTKRRRKGLEDRPGNEEHLVPGQHRVDDEGEETAGGDRDAAFQVEGI